MKSQLWYLLRILFAAALLFSQIWAYTQWYKHIHADSLSRYFVTEIPYVWYYE